MVRHVATRSGIAVLLARGSTWTRGAVDTSHAALNDGGTQGHSAGRGRGLARTSVAVRCRPTRRLRGVALEGTWWSSRSGSKTAGLDLSGAERSKVDRQHPPQKVTMLDDHDYPNPWSTSGPLRSRRAGSGMRINEALWTVEDTAAFFGVTVRTMYDWRAPPLWAAGEEDRPVPALRA